MEETPLAQQPTTPTPVKEQKQPKDTNPKTWVYLLIAIILLISSVAGIWFYMNRQQQSKQRASDASDASFQKQIKDLSKQLAEAKKADTGNTATPAGVAEKLKTFCSGLHTGYTAGYFKYVDNKDGEFGYCLVSPPDGVGGGMVISVYQNSAWKLVWEGNGIMAASLCTQYKIPKSIYEDCAGNY